MMLVSYLRHFNSQMHYFHTVLQTIIEVTLTYHLMFLLEHVPSFQLNIQMYYI